MAPAMSIERTAPEPGFADAARFGRDLRRRTWQLPAAWHVTATKTILSLAAALLDITSNVASEVGRVPDNLPLGPSES